MFRGITSMAGLASILMIPWWHWCRTWPGVPGRHAADPTAVAKQDKQETVGARVSPGTGLDGKAKQVDGQLADEVVLRALDERQPSFMRCFERAQRMDGVGRVDVKLHLEVDELGIVSKATNDAINDRLRVCVSAVAMHLKFSEPGRPVVLDVPLMFR
jgi:hypothetical protein